MSTIGDETDDIKDISKRKPRIKAVHLMLQ